MKQPSLSNISKRTSITASAWVPTAASDGYTMSSGIFVGFIKYWKIFSVALFDFRYPGSSQSLLMDSDLTLDSLRAIKQTQYVRCALQLTNNEPLIRALNTFLCLLVAPAVLYLYDYGTAPLTLRHRTVLIYDSLQLSHWIAR